MSIVLRGAAVTALLFALALGALRACVVLPGTWTITVVHAPGHIDLVLRTDPQKSRSHDQPAVNDLAVTASTGIYPKRRFGRSHPAPAAFVALRLSGTPDVGGLNSLRYERSDPARSLVFAARRVVALPCRSIRAWT